MGVGTLRRHREQDAAPEPEPEVAPSELTVAELTDELEGYGLTDDDLAPGSGSGGNVVKADRVEAVERLRAGESPEDVAGEGEDEGETEEDEG